MSNDVKIIKLVSQEIIIARLKEVTDHGIVVDDPCLIHVEGRNEQTGKVNLAFIPFMLFSDEKKGVVLNANTVIYMVDADAGITPEYQRISGQIVTPKTTLVGFQ